MWTHRPNGTSYRTVLAKTGCDGRDGGIYCLETAVRLRQALENRTIPATSTEPERSIEAESRLLLSICKTAELRRHAIDKLQVRSTRTMISAMLLFLDSSGDVVHNFANRWIRPSDFLQLHRLAHQLRDVAAALNAYIRWQVRTCDRTNVIIRAGLAVLESGLEALGIYQ